MAFTEGLTLKDNDGVRWRTRVVQLGELPLTSGAVALGDPATGLAPARPPSGTIAVGSYPVDLALAETLEDGGFLTKGDVRSTSARIRFGEGEVASWVLAGVSAGVDSGTCGFTDGDAHWEPSDEVSERLEDAIQATSYGPSVGATRFEVNESRVVFAFSSGLGDGVYAAYWGLNATGESIMLCLDFALLITSETEDVVLPWPLKRGKVEHEALRRAEVSARVPWLAPNTLRLRWTPGKKVRCVRWRQPDGRLTRPETKWGNRNELDVSLVGRPTDASLIVRLLAREVPMRPAAGSETGAG
ncbi:MAG: DUF4241 domain-containing protein [Deltaproteobacteria bacterium]